MNNTPEQQERHDALLGKDMEAFYRLDASLHPEQRRCYPPLAVSQTPEYQRLAGLAIEAQLGMEKSTGALAMLVGARDRLIWAAGPTALPKMDREQQELLQAAAKALGPFIGKAASFKRLYQTKADGLRADMRKLEEGGTEKMPAEERYSGMGVEAFERDYAGKGEA